MRHFRNYISIFVAIEIDTSWEGSDEVTGGSRRHEFYQGYHSMHGHCIMKKLSEEEKYRNDVELLRNFIHGKSVAAALAALSPEFFPRVWSIGMTSDGQIADAPLITEYCEGGSLFDFVHDQLTYEGVPLKTIIDFMEDICGALEVCHGAGYIYPDLKPDNIVLAYERGRMRFKLTDFEHALRSSSLESKLDRAIGTPQTIAPETWEKAVHNPRATFYSLGCTLYFVVFGKYPSDLNFCDSNSEFSRVHTCGVFNISEGEFVRKFLRRYSSLNAVSRKDLCIFGGPLFRLLKKLLSIHPIGRPENVGELREALLKLRTITDNAPCLEDAENVERAYFRERRCSNFVACDDKEWDTAVDKMVDNFCSGC